MKLSPFSRFLSLLLLARFNAFAQAPRLYFDRIGVYEGPPESNVAALIQDKLGYIWIGTQNGLVRRDGYQNKVYRFGLTDKLNLPNRNIVSLLEDKNGDLWISTRINGLYAFDDKWDKLTSYFAEKDASNRATMFPICSFAAAPGYIYGNMRVNGNIKKIRFKPGAATYNVYAHDDKVATSIGGDTVVTVNLTRQDNGTGIHDAIKDKIMQPLFTTKPTGEGTGLGLSLSYDIIIKRHGGKIDIQSQVNEGSTFTINLPV